MHNYYVKINGFDKDIFKKRGNWREYKKGDKKIDLVYIDRFNYIPPKFLYNMKINFENFTMILEGGNKRKIVDLFLQDSKTKKYVPKQIAFDPNNIEDEIIDFIQPRKIYIVKPIHGSGGSDILRIKNKNEFLGSLTKLKKIYRTKDKLIKDNKNWVLQEYLKKPLLYNKKKFHIRAYVILSDTGKGFLASSFLVILAKKEYRVSNLEDNEIHDTHRDNVSEIIDDRNFGLFNQEEYLKIKKAIVKISKIFIQKAKVECYNNVKDCFHIFGLDIMFEKDYNPIFIEANITPGTLRYNYLLEGIMQEIVDKKFPPKNKIKRNNHLIKL